MSAECLENAANAAAKRRELRRRKLLQSPEDRMKKIMGYSLPGNGKSSYIIAQLTQTTQVFNVSIFLHL